MRAKQLKLQGFQERNWSKGFGGSLLKKGHAKEKRPVSTKLPTHLVMRSTQAKGEWSFLRPVNKRNIEEILRQSSKKFGVRIFKLAIVSNHIHLLVLFANRHSSKGFLRATSGSIALKVSRANKLKGLLKNFWDNRPWTRIIEWGKSYFTAKTYLWMNQLESLGIIPYQPRGVRRRIVDLPAG